MDTKINSGSDTSSNIFLTGAILLANLDYSGLKEYAIKAAIGGLIWMAARIAGELISDYIKSKRSK